MKIKVSKIVPRGYAAITLWPFGIYFSEDRYMQSKRILNHEMIHWKQQKEMLGIPFYLLYFIDWIIRVVTPPWDTAYKDVTFEREAKRNDRDFNYLETRKRFAWVKYCFVFFFPLFLPYIFFNQ